MHLTIIKEGDTFLVVLEDHILFITKDYEEAREYVMRISKREV